MALSAFSGVKKGPSCGGCMGEQLIELSEAEYRVLAEVSRLTGKNIDEIATETVKRELERRHKKPKKQTAKVIKITLSNSYSGAENPEGKAAR